MLIRVLYPESDKEISQEFAAGGVGFGYKLYSYKKSTRKNAVFFKIERGRFESFIHYLFIYYPNYKYEIVVRLKAFWLGDDKPKYDVFIKLKEKRGY